MFVKKLNGCFARSDFWFCKSAGSKDFFFVAIIYQKRCLNVTNATD